MENEEEWIEWANNMLNQRQDDMNDVDEEDLRKWFKDYRREYNRKFCKDEGTRMLYGHQGKIQKKVEHRNGKYDEMFKGMTPEQISDLISKMDISKQKKWYLRKTYVRHITCHQQSRYKLRI